MGPYTRYHSSCGALVRPSGKTEESLIPNNHSTLLVLKKRKKEKNTPKIGSKNPNLTYIKLMLSELVRPRELKDSLK